MAIYNLSGLMPSATLCEDMALPIATSAALTNDITLQHKKGEDVIIKVYSASVTTELAGGASLTFTPYLADTVANLTASPTILPATIITQAVQSDASWASGEFICSFIIPKELIGTNNYLRIMATTSANESADKIEAFAFVRN